MKKWLMLPILLIALTSCVDKKQGEITENTETKQAEITQQPVDEKGNVLDIKKDTEVKRLAKKEDPKNKFLAAGYEIKDGEVYYYDEKIADADYETFEVFLYPTHSEYAQDSKNIYGFGSKLYVDKKSFEVLSFRYAKDKNKVYCFGEQMKTADAQTFTVPSDPYAKDKNQLYYNCEEISTADPSTFEVLSENNAGGIARDSINFYCNGDVYGKDYTNVDKDTYEVLFMNVGEKKYSRYARDKNHVYNLYYNSCDSIIEGADPETFEITKDGFGKDKNGTYTDGWEELGNK